MRWSRLPAATTEMKFAMLGSGGVGGYFGARLAAAGHEVTFIARGEHLAAIQAGGIHLESGLGNADIDPANATGDTADAGQVDCVIIAVKLWDTEAAGRAALPMLGPQTTVISLQNGVESDEILAPIVGPERLIGGVAFIASSIKRPGVIAHLGAMQRIVIGEPAGGASKRVAALESALLEAGINAEVSEDIGRTIWEKFVFLVGLSATTTLMRTTIGPVREDPESRAFLLDAMREVVAVGRAKGVGLAADFAENRLDFADGLPAEMTSSMRHDLDRGNKLEVGWLSGAVARFGQQLAIPVPVNRTVFAALKPLAASRA